MSVDVEGFPRRAATRWWHLDPRVIAHLRAPRGPERSVWANTAALTGRGASDPDDSPAAFAPTHWPDTEWSDTRSDLAP